MSKEDDVTKPIVLDLDAIGMSGSKLSLVTDAKKTIKGYSPVVGLSVGALQELSQKDPSKLTSIEKAQLDDATKRIKDAFVPIELPGLKIATALVKQLAKDGQKQFAALNLTAVSKAASEVYNLAQLQPAYVPVVLPRIIPPASSVEQQKQTFLLERMVEVFEAQNEDRYADLKYVITPRYDAEKKCLIFCNRIIDVTKGKDYEQFCKIMFRSGLPRKTAPQFGDVLDKLGIDDLKDTAKLRNLVNNFNTFIAKHTMVDDLFYAKQKEVYFNPKYV